MAERRMFAKTIIDSDAFLDMPLSTQALYFHLSMRADDDGFLNNAKKIMRTINATKNDYDLLVAKSFIIQFDDGICVIKHWRINNYLRADRYKPTIYQEEKEMLQIKENGRYSLKKGDGIPDGYHCETQVRLGKDRLGKDRLDIGSESKKDSEQEYADVPAIPLNNSTEWKMPLALYEEYKRIYPAVDIQKEVGKMRMWSMANPTKRKTPKGITRFVNSWLSKEQDRYHGNANTTNYEDIH